MPSGAVPPPVVPFGHQFPQLFHHHNPFNPTALAAPTQSNSHPLLAPQGPHTALFQAPPPQSSLCLVPPASREPNGNRIKIKRSRQRVDAGEPRNSYQSPLRANRSVFKPPTAAPQAPSVPSSVNSSGASNVESNFMFGTLTSILSAENGGWPPKKEKMVEEAEEQENCGPVKEEDVEGAEDEGNDDPEAPATATAEIDELESVELNVEDGGEDDDEKDDDSANTSTPSAGSSSSRRKSEAPRKLFNGDEMEEDEEEFEGDERTEGDLTCQERVPN
ncbi:hypothetical protein L596_024273 [Steinernema carpocapsae]|uniref:Uncharacterized protein n=1 Tax=Steinernema carpocapsae TaxID=34508 RepID=A0A4U5MGI6_STECR|nr:hypothetical protein L596_024273 [Steinernema carpocapsae]